MWGSEGIVPLCPNFGTRDARSTSTPDRFIPGEESPSAIKQGAGCAPQSMWALWRRENSLPQPGNYHAFLAD
jgi:hypothetical protein